MNQNWYMLPDRRRRQSVHDDAPAVRHGVLEDEHPALVAVHRDLGLQHHVGPAQDREVSRSAVSRVSRAESGSAARGLAAAARAPRHRRPAPAPRPRASGSRRRQRLGRSRISRGHAPGEPGRRRHRASRPSAAIRAHAPAGPPPGSTPRSVPGGRGRCAPRRAPGFGRRSRRGSRRTSRGCSCDPILDRRERHPQLVERQAEPGLHGPHRYVRAAGRSRSG